MAVRGASTGKKLRGATSATRSAGRTARQLVLKSAGAAGSRRAAGSGARAMSTGAKVAGHSGPGKG